MYEYDMKVERKRLVLEEGGDQREREEYGEGNIEVSATSNDIYVKILQ